MTELCRGRIGAICSQRGRAARVGDGLHLAAAPTFAIMALATAVLGHGAPDMFCTAMGHASTLGGMTTMYMLMSAFHVAPWLRLIGGSRAD